MTEYTFTTPLKEESIKKLGIGDLVYLTGTIYSARDGAHKRFLEYTKKGKKSPINLHNAVIFHTGPIVRNKNGEWKIIAAGPTTSSRLNKITPSFLANYSVRMIIGKGGMSDDVTFSMRKYGVVYCHFTGGAAVLAAQNIKRVVGVEWLDLGIPEAVWIFEVENFGPLTVTIDSKGNSMYKELREKIKANMDKIFLQLE